METHNCTEETNRSLDWQIQPLLTKTTGHTCIVVWEVAWQEVCPLPLHSDNFKDGCFVPHSQPALQRQNAENLKQIFPEKEYRGLSPNFHIHVSVSELYIPTMGLPILLEEICGPILGL